MAKPKCSQPAGRLPSSNKSSGACGESYDRAVIVALDVGNTNVRFALIQAGEVASSHSAPTASAAKNAELAAAIAQADQIVIVSVVPEFSAGIVRDASGRGIP